MVEEAFIRLCGQVETAKELKNYQVSLYREYQYEGMRLLNQKYRKNSHMYTCALYACERNVE